MKIDFGICLGICLLAATGFAHELKIPPVITPVTIETIDSDALVSQFWNSNPRPVEAIVLKRRQRARK